MSNYAHEFRNPSFKNPATGTVMPNDTGWQTRHIGALKCPARAESAIIGMIEAWARYADQHRALYGAKLADDSYLGPIWNDLGRSIHGLLNGETGRLDCGTLSSFIHSTRTCEGFSDE